MPLQQMKRGMQASGRRTILPGREQAHWPQFPAPFTRMLPLAGYWIVIGNATGKTVRKNGKVGASMVTPVA